MKDKYDREITEIAPGVYHVDGITVDTVGGGIHQALMVFNGMQPDGWVAPEEKLVNEDE